MGVSVCYSWEAIKCTENNYLFFFLVFLIIQSSFTDVVSIMICWSFILSLQHLKQKLKKSSDCTTWCFPAYLISQTSPRRAEGHDPVHFHALSAGERVSGNRLRVCWWSPAAYHFSAVLVVFFHPVTDQKAYIHQGYAERKHLKVTAGSGGSTVAQFYESCEPHL